MSFGYAIDHCDSGSMHAYLFDFYHIPFSRVFHCIITIITMVLFQIHFSIDYLSFRWSHLYTLRYLYLYSHSHPRSRFFASLLRSFSCGSVTFHRPHWVFLFFPSTQLVQAYVLLSHDSLVFSAFFSIICLE